MEGEDLRLPPGFRFHPTDEELVLHYLCRKCTGLPITSNVIREIDIYKHDPWQLPGMAFYGDKEWYFFSPRDRKYPNGSRPNRAAGSGYWKATGADKPVGKPKPAAIKKALVFYAGKPPRGVKTNWIMHEYRLADVDRSAKKEKGLKLDDWVLCRIYKKKETEEKLPSTLRKPAASQLTKSTLTSHVQTPALINTLCFYASDPPPTLNADSSCSEHVQSPSGTCEREVDSQPRWELGWDIAPDVLLNNIDAIAGDGGGGGFFPLSPGWRDALQDIFMFMESG